MISNLTVKDKFYTNFWIWYWQNTLRNSNIILTKTYLLYIFCFSFSRKYLCRKFQKVEKLAHIFAHKYLGRKKEFWGKIWQKQQQKMRWILQKLYTLKFEQLFGPLKPVRNFGDKSETKADNQGISQIRPNFLIIAQFDYRNAPNQKKNFLNGNIAIITTPRE